MRFEPWDNPMGTDGFEFVEFAHPDPAALAQLFATMGFTLAARHKSKNVVLYRQGGINFIINAEPGSFAQRFAAQHGPSAPAMAFRVADAKHAFDRAMALGAQPALTSRGPLELDIPALEGIGGLQIYLVDRYGTKGTIYDVDFDWIIPPGAASDGVGLHYIDHLTHNVARGHMSLWADFYEKLFGFREIRFFNIEGRHTGLTSRAMTSPCGKIRIPINESSDDKSQIEEYLKRYKGEGIQHVALGSRDLYLSIEALAKGGLRFMPAPPDTYYDRVDQRVPGHGEPLHQLRDASILIDGEGVVAGGLTKVLLQRFSKTVIGPIFFEFIQRKGDEGFGEGNFRALFESIEEDQIRRGVLKPGVES